MNTTTNESAFFNKQFYDKKLLETAKTRLVHANFGQKRNIPRHNGKSVEFRRYELFTPDANALTLQEGVTPAGQSLAQSKLETEVKQYGAYVEVSDLLDMTGYDEVIADSAELLGEQLGCVIEQVTRDEMAATTNLQYAGEGHSDRYELSAADVLTTEEIRKAVRTLKRNKARPFMSTPEGAPRKPHFVCICSPEATYDLQNDPLWRDVSKYSNAEQIYSGEIGQLFGVVFVESTESKVYAQTVYTQAVEKLSAGDTGLILPAPATAEQELFYKTAGTRLGIRESAKQLTTAGSAAALPNGNWEVQVDAMMGLDILQGWTVYSYDAGAVNAVGVGADVHAALVFGADAYGIVDVDGSGTMETIIKPCGSSGSLDPLNQRATVGAKVAAYAVKILNPLWLVKIEHTVSG
ncbi:MAG: N4-gp56 family major capsid protein [Clostridiales bacterium]|nr:N4-gp56 family major capsid protein [Clostridiales bacterium]